MNELVEATLVLSISVIGAEVRGGKRKKRESTTTWRALVADGPRRSFLLLRLLFHLLFISEVGGYKGGLKKGE